MNTFNDQVKSYYALDKAEKEIKAEKEPLNKSIKAYMKDMNMKSEVVEGISVQYSVQERTSPLQEKMLERLKDLGFLDAIKVIEVVDEDKVASLIHLGFIKATQLEDCFEVKKIETLTVKTAKKSKKE